MSFFTLEEATALLPWLTERLERLAALVEERGRLETQAAAASLLSRSNGGSSHAQETESRRRQSERLARQANEIAGEITARGILLRDLARGLVDFPSLREGREVHLCWLKGEDTVRFWHEAGAGFAGRQPL